MPKLAKELSALEVKRLTFSVSKKGTPYTTVHPVGGVSGLLLQCTPSGAKSWILRYTTGETLTSSTGKPYLKRRDHGLGAYPEVTLSKAREKAADIKEKLRQGVDPLAEKKLIRSAILREQAKAITFEQVAQEFIIKKAKEFKTAKQVQKLENHLKNYAYPHIGKLVVADIERAHIETMLKPVWETKNETASRVRMYVERILDLAGVKGLRSGDNPARWKGNLDLSFPARDKVAKVKHYAALPVPDLPGFMGKLTPIETMGAKALQFTILTAGRSGEIRGATWEEIDFKERIWTIPTERMKAGRQHKVPLSPAAISLLESMPRMSNYIFANNKGGPISDVTISKVPKTLGHNVTAHGFRSTFKDWARKHTAYADEVSELQLAHVNDDKTRAAYARDELLDKRRQLMNEWQNYCYHGHAKEAAKVVSIGKDH